MHQMPVVGKWVACLLGLSLVLGCITNGRYVPRSQFVFPNSNVTALGPTRVKRVKWSVIIPPSFTLKEMRDTYREALSKQAGANVLINYKEDTQVLMIPIYVITIYRLAYKLDGQAAKMEVGQQALR